MFGNRTRRLLLAVVVSVTLVGAGAACGDDDDSGAPATPTVGPVGPTAGPTPEPARVELRADGLGPVGFGDDMDRSVEVLVDLLGTPDEDQTVTDDMPDGLGGPDTTLRTLRFGPLAVSFTDWPYYRGDGAMHLARWILFDFPGAGADPSTAPATAEGVTLGSTIEAVRAAFGDALVVGEAVDECTGFWTFWVGERDELGLLGRLDGPPDEATSTVVFLTAGAQSSC